jgi:hypothetical protein
VAAKPVAAAMAAAAKPATEPKPSGVNITVAMLDPAYSFGAPPGTLSAAPPGHLDYRFAAPAPRQAAPPAAPDVARPSAPDVRHAVQGAPLPVRRPSEHPQSSVPSSDQVAQRNKVLPSAVALKPTIFEKLFGKPKEPEVALAYAGPDGGVLSDGTSITPGRYDQWTAVYDISAHTVYLPDGTKLEAHSGLGTMLDNPNFTHVRMRGATPAHMYDLEARPVLFHGVQAIRLKPVGGEAAIFNRNGILAHTYMLGPRGESNGCVSFKNYAAFLRAFQNHEIKRMAVVARLD